MYSYQLVQIKENGTTKLKVEHVSTTDDWLTNLGGTHYYIAGLDNKPGSPSYIHASNETDFQIIKQALESGSASFSEIQKASAEAEFDEYLKLVAIDLTLNVNTAIQAKIDAKIQSYSAGTANPISFNQTRNVPKSVPSKLSGRTLIIDENLSPTLKTALENEGYSIKIFEKGVQDSEIINYAKNNNAIVVTNNIKDFKNKGVTTFEVSESLKAKSQVTTVVNKIENIEKQSMQNSEIIKPGANLKLNQY